MFYMNLLFNLVMVRVNWERCYIEVFKLRVFVVGLRVIDDVKDYLDGIWFKVRMIL